MKAIIFWVFDHFANSPTNYRFFDTFLIVNYQKGEENWNSCLRSLFYHVNFMFLQGKICGSACVSRLFTKCLLHLILVKKNDISGYIWTRSFIQMVKCSLLDEKIVYQSFYGAPLTCSYFLLQGKVLCFACVGKSLARCWLSKAFRRPCQKSRVIQCISSYIWHRSFVQTVECFFYK